MSNSLFQLQHLNAHTDLNILAGCRPYGDNGEVMWCSRVMETTNSDPRLLIYRPNILPNGVHVWQK